MGLILAIETTANVCSVALFKGVDLVSIKESTKQWSHSSLITPFVEEVVRSANKKLEDIDAISVSKGPGSYTGLRIGISAAKGLCLALSIPLIGINTLESMVHGFTSENGKNPSLYCPLIDARRMEVFTAVYDNQLNCFLEPSSMIITSDSFSDILSKNKIIFFGSGSTKTASAIQHSNALFAHNFSFSASYMGTLSHHYYENGAFENTAYFKPLYIKDFYTPTS